MRLLSLVSVIVLAALARPAPAQEAPLSSLHVGLGAMQPAARGDFGAHWRVPPALDLVVETPFYAGDATVGAVLMRNLGRDAGTPDFSAAYLYVGWGASAAVGRMRFRGAVTAGDYLMYFGEEPRSFFRRENEMAVGLRTSAALLVSPRWELEAGALWMRVFTRRPIDIIAPAVTVRYVFEMAPWLSDFLR